MGMIISQVANFMLADQTRPDQTRPDQTRPDQSLKLQNVFVFDCKIYLS